MFLYYCFVSAALFYGRPYWKGNKIQNYRSPRDAGWLQWVAWPMTTSIHPSYSVHCSKHGVTDVVDSWYGSGWETDVVWSCISTPGLYAYEGFHYKLLELLTWNYGIFLVWDMPMGDHDPKSFMEGRYKYQDFTWISEVSLRLGGFSVLMRENAVTAGNLPQN